MQTARAVAVANENRNIEESTGRAVAAAEQRDKPKNALQAMSERYGMSQGKLVDTLRATVFSTARNEAEFNALIVVANEYKLNPLLKEIYAFPAKGQGIVPMVSVDGWIRIMNEHPDFDGIEFIYHADEKGDIEAIESVIHHKRRAHPIQTTEFMVECKRETDPWRKSPRRMLRHRALMQGARIAFGFAGIYVEDDVVIEGDYSERSAVSLPSAQQWDNYDDTTGEVIEDAEAETMLRDNRGMSEVDEETARELDAAAGQGEGPTDSQRGERFNGTDETDADEAGTWQKATTAAIDGAAAAQSLAELKKVETEFDKHRVAVPEEAAKRVDNLIAATRKALRQAAAD